MKKKNYFQIVISLKQKNKTKHQNKTKCILKLKFDMLLHDIKKKKNCY